MPDQSAKLFSMIINLFKSVDSSVQGIQDNSPVRKRHPRSVLKQISTLLEKVPWQFKPDIVSIVPKLVNTADHTVVASLVLSQVAASGYELPQQEEEKKAEAARFEQEELLKNRAAESEAAYNHLMDEKKAEAARFEQEKESWKNRAAESEQEKESWKIRAAESEQEESWKNRAAGSEQEKESWKIRAAESEQEKEFWKNRAAGSEQEKEFWKKTAADYEAELRMMGFEVDFLKSVNDFMESEQEKSHLDFKASIY